MAKLGIVFTKHCRPYNDGDKAGFEPAEAEFYVSKGVAIWDARLNPGGKHLAHHELPEDIRAHREGIHAADMEQGRIPKGTPFPGAVKVESVPSKGEVVEKGAGGRR